MSLCERSREITIDGAGIALPRRELSIFEMLIRSAGRVVTRDRIESAVYGYDDEFTSNTIEAHMSRLRKVLKEHNAGVRIHAVRGVGYMMQEDKPC